MVQAKGKVSAGPSTGISRAAETQASGTGWGLFPLEILSTSPMSTAQSGDAVRIHYTGRLNDGTVFDSSEGREPLGFTLGSGEVIPGFDQGVAGMDVGETKTIEIPAEEAYGAYRDDLALQVGRDQFPADIDPEVGQQLQLGMADGGALSVVVTEINDETVTLDANHPLAGKDLIFDLELVSVNG